MKKCISVLLTMIFVLGAFIIPISAAEQKDVSQLEFLEIFQKGTITEINENAITIEYDRVISNVGSPFSFNSSETRQKDYCTIILDGTVNPEDVVNSLTRATNSQTTSHDGEAARVYCTINYNISRIGYFDYAHLVSASGRVVKYNSRTTVVQNEVVMGTCGAGVDGEDVNVYRTYYFPNAYSWSLDAPSECVPVEMTAVDVWTFVGCNYTCTLKRGTSNIEYKIINNVLS